ncbi:NAD-dependent epimerase/dehydratase family protein [Verrucomicrobiota bacterium]
MTERKIPEGTPVLVTGATGFTGAVLTRKLAEAGLKINAIARETSNTQQLADLDINWFKGDVFNPETVSAAADGVEYIFHVAAAFREAKLSDIDYWNVHFKSTKLLAEASLKNSSFKRFVHISTVGVHSHIENPPADENYPIQPGDIYQKTKAEAELWLREFAKEHNLPYTILRPAAIYGPGDKRLLKVFKMAAWKYFPLIGRGKCLYHLIHVEDLANIMILAATHEAALGEVFICGNPECFSLEQIGKTVAEILNNNFKIIRLPAWPFFVAGYLCEFICKPFGIEPPIYPRRVAFFTKDRSFDTLKLRKTLGYQVKYSNEQGLKQTAEWYIEQGWMRKRRMNDEKRREEI